MDTIRITDYFAPLAKFSISNEMLVNQKFLPIVVPQVLSLQQPRNSSLSHLDRADFFTYLIMGLAVLIAIIVPLLNLS